MKAKQQRYLVLGLMSGTSCDGLDMALCDFEVEPSWNYQLKKFRSEPYEQEFADRIRKFDSLTKNEQRTLEAELSEFWIASIQRFLGKEKVDLIASHGQTVGHFPKEGYSVQIGDHQQMTNCLNAPVAYDFRNADMQLAGQGAPLVPIADKLLFSQYQACINLGGIANISFDEYDRRIGFDIGICNAALNHFAQSLFSQEYDKGGALASIGQSNKLLVDQLNDASYYKKSYPKSLDRDAALIEIIEIINAQMDLSPNDILSSLVDHVTYQISLTIPMHARRVLISGGGARNSFLINTLRQRLPMVNIEINDQLTDSKEAIAFAFLGILRFLNRINILASYTGAERDSCSGEIVFPQTPDQSSV